MLIVKQKPVCAKCGLRHGGVGDARSYKRDGSCSSCGNKRTSGQANRYCRKCHAQYMRGHRKKYRELSPEAKKRANARSTLKMAIRRGQVTRDPCQGCGTKRNVEGHHTDYDYPLDVEWLCRRCHMKEHGRAT